MGGEFLSNKKNKKLTPIQQEYQDFVTPRQPKRPILMNCIKAFVAGGFVCVLGQGIQSVFINYFNFDKTEAGNPTVAVLIFISVVLTSFGVYDKIAQWAGAGTAVPVTGFANTIASSAIEYKSEGYVLGVGANMFKLAGPVIVFGVFSAFIVAVVKTTIKWLGVI
jgi:stage V sporulation protein AC